MGIVAPGLGASRKAVAPAMPRADGNLCTDAVIKSLLHEGWVRASPTGAPQAPAHVRPAGGPRTTVGGFWEGPFLPLGSGTPCVSAAPSGGKRAPGGRPEGWQVAERLPPSPNQPWTRPRGSGCSCLPSGFPRPALLGLCSPPPTCHKLTSLAPQTLCGRNTKLGECFFPKD